MLKTNISKSIKTIVLTFSLSLIFFICSYAGTAGIYFSDPQVTVGTDVYVTMKISSDDGTNLSNANVVLSYPTDSLEFISGTDSDGGAGAIRVHGASNGAGTTELEYNLGFRTLSAGTASISISSYEVYDAADEPVDINHQGSATITVDAGDTASSDASLSSLEVSPGELTPAFSTDVTSYSVTVGSSVNSLSINAIAQDTGANVSIQNNSDFQMGDNTVTITVQAADGVSSAIYTIVVSKVEGGPEVDVNQTAASTEDEGIVEGVQLYSKGRTITIISPDDSVEVPQGFRSGVIRIDDQRVQGWMPEGTDDPEYCLVYGMNEDGESYFYRYDMQERSIQRYLSDPGSDDKVSGEEYSALQTQYEDALSGSRMRLIIIVILSAIVFVLAIFCAYLLTKNRSLIRSGKLIRYQPGGMQRKHKNHVQDEDSVEDDGLTDDVLLSSNGPRHDFKAESNLEVDDKPGDETQVIRRSSKRRSRRRVSQITREANRQANIEDRSDNDQINEAKELSEPNSEGSAEESDGASREKVGIETLDDPEDTKVLYDEDYPKDTDDGSGMSDLDI